MDILKRAQAYEDYVIAQRRWFHQHPEAAWEEVETTLAVERQLEEIGLCPIRFEDISGVYAEIKGRKEKKGDKILLLRADIDGVRVREETGVSFSSINSGLMHATGRDCHIAMLLGVARVLHEIQDELAGNVRILFQAAEESAQGAHEYISRGIMQGVTAAYAAHVYGGLNTPSIDVSSGQRMASADRFTIKVTGLTASGSNPHLGRDAIVAAAEIISAIQLYVTRNNNPLNPLVVTIGTIHGGTQRNLVADCVYMEGTVRTHSVQVHERLESELREVISRTASVFGCSAELEYCHMLPPMINDTKLSAIATGAVNKLFPNENVLTYLPPLMTCEDFSCYGDFVPIIYANLGCANQTLGYTQNNYSSKFMVDESILVRGVALCAQFTVDYLNS